jgi:hypothetical protein
MTDNRGFSLHDKKIEIEGKLQFSDTYPLSPVEKIEGENKDQGHTPGGSHGVFDGFRWRPKLDDSPGGFHEVSSTWKGNKTWILIMDHGTCSLKIAGYLFCYLIWASRQEKKGINKKKGRQSRPVSGG